MSWLTSLFDLGLGVHNGFMLAFRIVAGHRARRAPTGGHIAEFGAALVILTTIILIPLLDLVVVPVRWMMAQNIANSYSRKLALCESFSQSCHMIESEPFLKEQLLHLGGVTVQSVDMFLRISKPSGDFVLIDTPGQIPPDALPDGETPHCLYSIQLNVKLLISPAILVHWSGQSIPGLTAPIPIMINASHEWENLGRNPATKEFFLNE